VSPRVVKLQFMLQFIGGPSMRKAPPGSKASALISLGMPSYAGRGDEEPTPRETGLV